MRQIVSITEDNTATSFPVIQQLRPHLTLETFREKLRRQNAQGFHLIGVEEDGRILGLAGYRILEFLAWGKTLYVDDLVTDENTRSTGVGKMLLDWLKDEARRKDCEQFHLDSNVQRFGAHRFYLRERLDIVAHHFAIKLKC